MLKMINILNRLIPLFFIISFTIIFILYIAKKVYHQDLNLNIYLNLFIILFNLIFWFFILLSKNKLKKIFVLSYFSILLALYFSEFILEKKSKFNEFQYFLNLNKNYDTRSKFEIYKDLKKKTNISPLYYPYNQLIKNRKIEITKDNKNVEILAISGVSKRKTIVCNETGEYLIYTSDRYGFNNPNHLWDKKIDAITLGDSMTLGECVPPGNDIASLLRKKVNKNIINLGMGGNGPLFQLATLKEYYDLTNANKIIWIYYEGNDLLDLHNEKKNKILVKYLIPNFKQNLNEIHEILDKKILEVIDEEYSEYQSNKKKSFFLLWKVRSNIKNFLIKKNKDKNGFNIDNKKNIPNVYKKLINIESGNPYKDNLNYYKKILKSVKQFSIENNLENYFVYIPSVARFNGEFQDTNKLFEKDMVLSIANDLNFGIIDTHEIFFKNQNNPLKYFPFNGKRRHFNTEGYEVISDIIMSKIYN